VKNGMGATIINIDAIDGTHDIPLLPQDAMAALNGIHSESLGCPGPVPGPVMARSIQRLWAALGPGPNAMGPMDLLSRQSLNEFRPGLPWHLGAGEECHGCHQFH
jgi:hypothetical protein